MSNSDKIYARRTWSGKLSTEDSRGRLKLCTWKVTAELHGLGLQAPYFSVTYEEADRRGEASSGGCNPERCIELAPACAPFVRWHLTSPKGPMHYTANALYWAGVESYTDGNGFTAYRRSKWCDKAPSPGSPNPPHWPYFASTIVLGSVDGDPTIEELRSRWEAQVSPGADIAAFLDARLVKMLSAFRAAMEACFEGCSLGDVAGAFAYDEDAARVAAKGTV